MLKTLNIEHLKKKANSQGQSNPIRRARKILKILGKYHYKCVKCGAVENLTIDHINGRDFAKYDNAQKYKLEKCQVLCVKCHLEKNKQKQNEISN